MRTPLRPRLALLAAAAVAVPLALAGPASATKLDLGSLPAGPPPAEQLNTKTGFLSYGEAGATIKVVGDPYRLQKVRSGVFLTQSFTGTKNRLELFKPFTAQPKVVLSKNAGDVVVSPHGSRVAYVEGDYETGRVVVKKLDGTVVAKRSFQHYPTLAMWKGNRIFLTQNNRTLTWVPGASTTKVFLPHGHAITGDPATGRLSLLRGAGYPQKGAVIRVSDKKTLWQSPAKFIYEFSAKGTYGLAVSPESDGYGPGKLIVVNSRTGTTVRTLTGGTFFREAWESDTSFVTIMEDLDTHRSAMVRCRITGPCERASKRYSFAADDLPAGGAVPFLAAAH